MVAQHVAVDSIRKSAFLFYELDAISVCTLAAPNSEWSEKNKIVVGEKKKQ